MRCVRVSAGGVVCLWGREVKATDWTGGTDQVRKRETR